MGLEAAVTEAGSIKSLRLTAQMATALELAKTLAARSPPTHRNQDRIAGGTIVKTGEATQTPAARLLCLRRELRRRNTWRKSPRSLSPRWRPPARSGTNNTEVFRPDALQSVT